MDLVRDLLDKKVVDRNGREIGRVDSVVLENGVEAPARVAALEIGPAVLAHRMHPVLGRWIAAIEHGLAIDEGRPMRVVIGDVLEIADHVKVDRAFSETPAATLELSLRRWVGRLPGSS